MIAYTKVYIIYRCIIFFYLKGPLPGAPSRDFHMNIEDAELEYAPTAGTSELTFTYVR